MLAWEAGDWRIFLQRYPSLTEIDFTSLEFGQQEHERVFRALSPTSGGPICPELQNIAFREFALGDESPDVLRECLKARENAGIPKLKKLTMTIRWTGERRSLPPDFVSLVDELEYEEIAMVCNNLISEHGKAEAVPRRKFRCK